MSKDDDEPGWLKKKVYGAIFPYEPEYKDKKLYKADERSEKEKRCDDKSKHGY